jgi:hypothetical protein
MTGLEIKLASRSEVIEFIWGTLDINSLNILNVLLVFLIFEGYAYPFLEFILTNIRKYGGIDPFCII